MKCKKCGYELKSNWNVCPKCSKIIEDKSIEDKSIEDKSIEGKSIEDKSIEDKSIEDKSIEDKSIENKSKIKEESTLTSDNDGKYKIYLIVFFIGSICFWIFDDKLREIGFFVALIAIVTGFIKYPKNRAIKVIFWLFLAGVIAFLLFVMLLIYSCSTATTNISNSCQ